MNAHTMDGMGLDREKYDACAQARSKLQGQRGYDGQDNKYCHFAIEQEGLSRFVFGEEGGEEVRRGC